MFRFKYGRRNSVAFNEVRLCLVSELTVVTRPARNVTNVTCWGACAEFSNVTTNYLLKFDELS
jgi:hypothetical protein